MKKAWIWILALLLTVSCAGAEKGLTADFTPESAEAALAEVIAGRTGLPLTLVEGAEPGKAANLMLADPECVLCGSQQALIFGLQGYTSADLRQAMTPVCRVAVSPLYLVMDPGTAEAYGIRDLETLTAYIAENEYELTYARHLGADTVDRAVVRLSNETAVLTDYFRAEEIADALRDGEADAAVFSGQELAESGETWLVLCCLGAERSAAYPDVPCAAEAGWTSSEGVWIALFASSEVSAEDVSAIAAAALAVPADALPAGYEYSPLEGEACREAVQELFRDYKAYMTAEGLFFYEE